MDGFNALFYVVGGQILNKKNSLGILLLNGDFKELDDPGEMYPLL